MKEQKTNAYKNHLCRSKAAYETKSTLRGEERLMLIYIYIFFFVESGKSTLKCTERLVWVDFLFLLALIPATKHKKKRALFHKQTFVKL